MMCIFECVFSTVFGMFLCVFGIFLSVLALSFLFAILVYLDLLKKPRKKTKGLLIRQKTNHQKVLKANQGNSMSKKTMA